LTIPQEGEPVDEKRIVLLVGEWKEIMSSQREIKKLRGEGLIGILVSGDDLARKYQALQGRIWEIRHALFGEYYMGA